jgi:hypothetical protein
MRNITLFIILLQSLLMQAQNGKITGRIYDEINNEPIIGANITIQNSDIGAVSDIDGNFSIENLNNGFYNIAVTYIGYKTETKFEIEVSSAKPVTLNFALKEDKTILDSVIIIANPFERKSESPLSLSSIGINEIQRNPGGNRDISRTIKNLPGVASGVGFRNDLLVRGGGPNENRFYLDDIEIPTINHFQTQGASGGSNGLLNVDFINNADFYTGAFPANRGNAMSSVLQLTQREGRKDRVGLTFTLGASEAGITLEGPLTKKKKTTFLLNGRYSYLQGLFKVFGLPFLPTYSDAQFKINHKFNNKHDLTVLGVGAFDKLRLNLAENETADQKFLLRIIPMQDQWNYTIGVRYRYFLENSYMIFVASRSMFGNHIYKYQNNNSINPKLYDLNSTEAENKLRFEHTIRKKGFKINYGINYEFDRFTTTTQNTFAIQDSILNINYSSALNMNKYGLFAQVSKNFVDDKLSLSLGVRADGNSYNKNMANLFNQLSPRFSASYAFNNIFSMSYNVGLYYQSPSYTTLGYRNNDNILVNQPNLKYIRNLQNVFGIAATLKSNTKISIEGFHKLYYNYPMLTNKGISLANLGGDFGWVGDEPATSTSKGKTYGVEFAVQQKLWKGIFGILSYTWYRSLFTNAKDEFVSSSWDSRHVLNLTAGYKFKRNWELGIRWTIQGGLPYTPYDTTNLATKTIWDATNGNPLADYTKLNTLRTKALHAMNLRVDKKWFFKKWNLNLYLDIQNLYASKQSGTPNLDVVRDANDNPITDPNDATRYQLQYLNNNNGNIIPSIGVVIEF